ncbi:MAG: TIGR02391 family protein [Dolichospermum sp.]
MQTYNLNDTQKERLKWIVSEVRAGKLNEENIWVIWTAQGTSLVEYQGHVPEIEKTTLDALENNGCLICSQKDKEYKCALTSLAFEAIDSNFGAPDLSAILHLTPLTEIDHLDTELWDRCRLSLSAGGADPKAWDKAVRTATVVLEERLRKLGRTEDVNPDATSEGIVNIIFAGKNPVLSGKLEEKKLKAYRDLYAGMMSVFRNSYAHRIIDPSPEIGGAIIVFIDLLLKMLEDIDWDTDEGEA